MCLYDCQMGDPKTYTGVSLFREFPSQRMAQFFPLPGRHGIKKGAPIVVKETRHQSDWRGWTADVGAKHPCRSLPLLTPCAVMHVACTVLQVNVMLLSMETWISMMDVFFKRDGSRTTLKFTVVSPWSFGHYPPHSAIQPSMAAHPSHFEVSNLLWVWHGLATT